MLFSLHITIANNIPINKGYTDCEIEMCIRLNITLDMMMAKLLFLDCKPFNIIPLNNNSSQIAGSNTSEKIDMK